MTKNPKPHYCLEPSCSQIILSGEYCSCHQSTPETPIPQTKKENSMTKYLILIIILLIVAYYWTKKPTETSSEIFYDAPEYLS